MASQALFAPVPKLLRSAKNSLSPAQSLTVVEVFINAALACICHTRGLIPWDSACFRKRYIDDLQSDFWKTDSNGYSAFCDREPVDSAGESQEFRILKRGEDKRADRVLDMIETGVFSAVDGGFLEAVRFFVTQGGTECHPADVLESYTLNFSYNHGNGNQRVVSKVSFDSTHVFATDNTIKSFKRAIKGLLTSLQGLPLMPRKRSLGVAMLYNDRCPSGHEILGFVTEDLPLAAKEQSGWHKLLLQQTGEVGDFEVGPYRVVVGTSNIRQSIEESTSSQARELDVRMQLQSWQNSSSRQDNGLLSTLDAPRSDPHRAPTLEMLSPFPSSVRTGSRPSRADGMAPGSRLRNVAPETVAELIGKACTMETHHTGSHIFDRKDLKKDKITRLNASLGAVVCCGCGDESSDGKLLLCILCGTSQHMECYGWKSFLRSKLPDEHVCYLCLLLPREVELEARMPALIHKRLALEHLKEKNPTNATTLMNAMHLSNTEEDHKIFNDIIDTLQQDGYLTRGGSAIKATTGKAVTAKAFRSILNPIAQISHHYSVFKDGEDASSRKKDIRDAIKEHTRGQDYLPREGHINDKQQNTPQQARKRKASNLPVEETPHQKSVRADKATHRKPTRSMDKTPPTEPLTSTPVTRKASCCESLACLDRSSPSTVFSLSTVLEEAVLTAVSDVQWEEFASRNRSKSDSHVDYN